MFHTKLYIFLMFFYYQSINDLRYITFIKYISFFFVLASVGFYLIIKE